MDITNYTTITQLSRISTLTPEDAFILTQSGESKHILYNDLSSNFKDMISVQIQIGLEDYSNQVKELSTTLTGHLSDYELLVSSVLALRNCGIKTNRRIDVLSAQVSGVIGAEGFDVNENSGLSNHIPSSKLLSTTFNFFDEQISSLNQQVANNCVKYNEFSSTVALCSIEQVCDYVKQHMSNQST